MNKIYKPETPDLLQNKEHRMLERQLCELKTEAKYLQWRKERILEKMEYINGKPNHVKKVTEWLDKWF